MKDNPEKLGEKMKEPVLSVAEVMELMDAFRKSGLGSFAYKQGEFSLTLENRKVEQVVTTATELVQNYTGPMPQPEEEAAPQAGNLVTSPIVGTFYEAPAPDKPPFVTVGQKVRQGDVLFIIESMKLMNEVVSEYDGTVAEIYTANEAPVEFGQPILRIE